MATIDELRVKIDQIDTEIMNLLDQRYALSTKIGEIKQSSKTAILDSKREDDIINKISKYSHYPQIKQVYQTIMKESKALQRK